MRVTQAEALTNRAATCPARRPRLGFAGVGWIGRHRLNAIADSGAATIACIADPAADAAQRARAGVQAHAPDVRIVDDFAQLLDSDLDGVVIATPSALHASQCSAALERGLAVFCQKPLARTAAEAAEVIATARKYDRLLAVDFCYRAVSGVARLRELVLDGTLGEIYAADLTFHNAYGPDKPWFYDRDQSGGGCVMDLGVHLADLLLWVLDAPRIASVSSRLYAGGRLLGRPADALEDYATAQVHFASGATARMACSWRVSAGRDAVIEAVFYGTRGAVAWRNVGGSFFDFMVEHYEGTRRRVLAGPPDDWGGRTIGAWARRLAVDRGFDPEAERLQAVSALVDGIYGR